MDYWWNCLFKICWIDPLGWITVRAEASTEKCEHTGQTQLAKYRLEQRFLHHLFQGRQNVPIRRTFSLQIIKEQQGKVPWCELVSRKSGLKAITGNIQSVWIEVDCSGSLGWILASPMLMLWGLSNSISKVSSRSTHVFFFSFSHRRDVIATICSGNGVFPRY